MYSGEKMKDQKETLVYVLAGLVVVSGVGGYLWGVGSVSATQYSKVSLEESGFAALDSKVVQSVNAELQGTLVETKGGIIVIEKEGEAFELTLPVGYEQVELTITSELTEADKQVIVEHEAALEAYSLAMSEIDYDTAMMSEDENQGMPVYPMINFDYSFMGMADDPTMFEGANGQTKTVRRQVGLEELQPGDLVRVNLSSYAYAADMTTMQGEADAKLNINGIVVMRNETTRQ